MIEALYRCGGKVGGRGKSRVKLTRFFTKMWKNRVKFRIYLGTRRSRSSVDKLFGEVLSEEVGEGGGGNVLGGEAEDVSDLYARIELGVLS